MLPHIDYSNITCGHSKSKNIDQIRKQQKKVKRNINIVGANYNAQSHTEIPFGQSKILKEGVLRFNSKGTALCF